MSTTLFKEVGYSLSKLIDDIEMGDIGLPDIQRLADGFNRLTHGKVVEVTQDTFEDRIARGEGMQIEFKATLRMNLHTGSNDPKMEHAVLKTLAAFLNSQEGGTLFVGVNDEGDVVGLDADQFANED